LSTSTANLSITLHPSKTLLLSLVFLKLLAVVSVILLSIPIWIKGVVVCGIVIIALHLVKQHALLKHSHSITSLNCAHDKKCKIKFNDGNSCNAEIISAEWLFNYFAVFVFQNKKKKLNATIAKDSMSQEQFYALRLYLRSLNK